MPTLDVICLANSHKHGGRCVAGLRTDGGGWVRPVSVEPEGVLQAWHYTLAKGGEAALLDVLRMRLTSARPDPHHPENWLMDFGLWSLTARPLPQEARGLLRQSLTPGPDLLGDRAGRIAYADMVKRPVLASLALVRPEGLSWQVRQDGVTGKRRTRAVFRLAGAEYDLPVTDPACLKAFNPHAPGVYPDKGAETLLTVSLGEPYGRDGYCYKLVAAIITL